MQQARVMVLDTETTGVDVEADRVVELGAAYFEAGSLWDVRRMRINPGRPIPEAASAIHGIRDEDVRHKPTFAEIGARFWAHVEGTALSGPRPLLAGYNASGFDIPLLNAELSRAGLPWRIDASKVLDLMVFVRWHHRDLQRRSLESVCHHYQIPLVRAHSALEDAKATGALLLRLVAEGLVPTDVEEALAEQRRLCASLQEERTRWSYWVYRDRRDGRLRIGAGRHCGRLLEEVDTEYLSSLLERIADLPPPVRALFEERVQ